MSNQSAICNLQSEIRALAALSAVAASVSQSLDLKETLTTALDATLEATGFEVGGIALWNEKAQRLEQMVTQGVEPQLLDAFLGPLRANGNRERVLRTGQPVFHEDTAHDPSVNPEIARLGFTLSAIVPLVHQGRVLGLLAVATRAPRHWTAEDKLLLTAVGRQTAVAVANAQLYEETRRSEEKYRSLVNMTADLIFTVDVEGTILFANPAAKAFTGYEPDETIGHHFSEYVHPEDVPILLASIQQALSGEPLENIRGIGQPAEYRMRKRNGQIVWVQHRAWPLRDAEGNIVGFSGIARDITERKRAEEALRESEDRYRDLVEHIHDLICTHDLEGNLLSVNRAVTKLLGYSKEEIVGRNLRDFLAPQVRHLFDAYISEIQRRGAASGLMKVLTKSGEVRVWQYDNTLRTEGVEKPIVRGYARDVTEQRRAEKQLREAERFARSTLDSLSAHIAILDADGVILAVNRAWRRFAEMNGPLCGNVREGGNYLAVCDAAQGDDQAIAREFAAGIRRVLSGEAEEFTLEYPCHSPIEQRWFIGRVTRFVGEGPVRVVVAHEDITERKQAEKELIKLSTAVAQSPSIIAITDTEGNLEYVNPKFTEVTGYSREEVIGQNLLILRSGEHPPEMYKELWETISSGRTWRGELRNKKKNGELYWELASISPVVDEQGNIINYIKVAEDITERKQREEKIRRHAVHMEALNRIIAAATTESDMGRLLATTLDQVLAALNAPSGAIWVEGHRVTRNLPSDLGHLSVHLIDQYRLDFCQPLDIIDWASDSLPEPLAAIGRDLFLPHGIRATLAVPILSEERHIGVLAVSFPQPHTWTEEEIALLEAVGRQLGAAVERLRLIEQLQEALKAKDEMIQNVSHELRTPLTMIRGYAEMMAEGYLGEMLPRQKQAIRVMLRNIEQLHFMVDRLVEMRSIQQRPLNKVMLNLGVWLERHLQGWRPRLKRAGLGFEMEVAPDVPPVLADGELLAKVVDNLMDNAIKFSPDGGTVRVRVWAEGDEVILAVSDEGVGIPPSKLEAIFERFYQVDGSTTRRFGGMGIGLALCREIVVAHGGRIWAESEGEGKGSTLYVALPAQE